MKSGIHIIVNSCEKVIDFYKLNFMNSYILLDTTAMLFFFLANLLLKQSISSEYVMVDFICIDSLDKSFC